MPGDSAPATSYALHQDELEAAVKALQRAAETFRPTSAERFFYRTLRLCLQAAAVGFVGTVAGLFASGAYGPWLLLFGVLLVGASLVTAPVLFILNFGFLRKVLRYHRVRRSLGVDAIPGAVWRTVESQSVVRRIGRSLGTFIGVLFLLSSLLAWARAYQSLHAGDSSMAVWLALCGLALLLIGIMILILRLVHRRKEELEIAVDADRLRAALKAMRVTDDRGTIEVPTRIIQQAGAIESAHIERERMTALAGRSASGAYALAFGATVLQNALLLTPSQRAGIEDAIDRVVRNPRTAAAPVNPDSVLRRATTVAGDFAVECRIDDAHRTIHVVALIPLRLGDAGVAMLPGVN